MSPIDSLIGENPPEILRDGMCWSTCEQAEGSVAL